VTGARVTGTDRAVLRLWLLTRVAVFVVAGAAGYLLATGEELTPYLDRWWQWDVRHFEEIASTGYQDSVTDTPLAAFFPGLPMATAAISALGIDLTLAGLLVSLVAGGVAVLALGRLGDAEGPAGTGQRAVLLLLLAPSAVFLAAGYTEALFLAFALPAWLMARDGRWWVAGLLAAGASSVRITGLFLAAALVVEFVVSRHRRRPGDAAALLLPLVPPALFAYYLHRTQGDWLAWLHAQEEGWYRRLTDPVTSFTTTWDAAFGGGQPLEFQWAFRAEIVAVLVGVALTVWCLRSRRWAEATYVGLQVVAFATSTWYFSVPRATLLWWPLWILLAQATLRRPALLSAYLAVVAPLSVLLTCVFVTGRWAG
jgi:hypothetical protein